MPRGRGTKRKAPSQRKRPSDEEKRVKGYGEDGKVVSEATTGKAAVPSLSTGSDVNFDIECAPCSTDGHHKEAERYCRECGEHLCGDCVRYHSKLSSLKTHQLMDNDALTTTQGDLHVWDTCAETCPEHKNEIIKLFCPGHNVTACVICMALNHKPCERMEYIEDVAAGLEDRQDYKEFTAKLGSLVKQSDDTVTLATENKQRSSDCHTKTMLELSSCREELVDAIDRHVKPIRDHAGQIHAHDTGKMDKLASQGNKALTTLRAVTTNVKTLKSKKHFCKLFVEMKRQEKAFREMQVSLDYIMKAGSVTAYAFRPGKDLHAMIDRQPGVGKLVNTRKRIASTTTNKSAQVIKTQGQDVSAKQVKNVKAFRFTDITLKSTINTNTYTISGMDMVSDDTIVIVDYYSGTIKLIETVGNKILSERKEDGGYPFDVTTCNDTVAVTFPVSKKIVFLKHAGGLVHDREISVNGDCRGIDWYDNKLYVIYGQKQKLEVMTTAGAVLQTFSKTAGGQNLFEYPSYVTVNAAYQRIYVSEWDRVKVLDKAGNQTGMYRDEQLSQPRQLAVDRTGAIALCNDHNNNVQLLSPDGKIGMILLTKRDGVSNPVAVCFCEATGLLYVGMRGCNEIKVYNVT